jgi:hypothetical protein
MSNATRATAVVNFSNDGSSRQALRSARPALASPRVSVIVLNHNGDRIIGKCLDHLLTCTVGFAGSRDRQARIVIRALGSLEPCVSEVFTMPGTEWTWRTFLTHLPAGDYELLLLCEDLLTDRSGRKLGVAVSLIRFE